MRERPTWKRAALLLVVAVFALSFSAAPPLIGEASAAFDGDVVLARSVTANGDAVADRSATADASARTTLQSLSTQADSAIDAVRKDIQSLPVNPTKYKAADRKKVEAIQARFDKLSAKDQATLDAECTHPGTEQPLGRVLEAALWAVRSYDKIDNSTTLPDGVYDTDSDPALASEYSKGKSTSPRDRPWSVKEVSVSNGKATATITVESRTYTGIWMGGVVYKDSAYPDGWTDNKYERKSGNCEFADVPIDLNSTFYFAGISTSMPYPIAFSLTTAIDETDPEKAEVEAVRKAVAKLPDPKSILNDTGNEEVAAVVVAYKDLSDEQRAQITDKECLHLAKCAIAILPEDPFNVTGDCKKPIEDAQDIYDSLLSLQGKLDHEAVISGVSYGRYLESAAWALDGLKPVNNETSLEDGTYTDQVKTTNYWGKRIGGQKETFAVRSVTVKAGKATAILEQSAGASEVLRMGGKEYANLQTDPQGNSYFEIPINIDSTSPFHFSAMREDAAEGDIAETYELVVEANNSMKPDSDEDDKKSNSRKNKNKNKNEDNGGSSPTGAPIAPQPGGTGGAGTSGGTSAGAAGTATSLDPLLRTSNQTSSSPSGGSSTNQSALSATTTGAQASTNKGGATDGATDKRVSGISTIVPADGASWSNAEDLQPAVAGIVLLMISSGVLFFAWRFVKNESIE